MARRFRRRKGRYVAHLDSDERALLVSLLEQARHIVEPRGRSQGAGGDAFAELMRHSGVFTEDDEHADPALARLVPPGHHDDEQVAREFRHLTAYSVRDAKATRIQTALTCLRESGDEVNLDPDEADALLAALTDVRLILADRLGLETDADADALADIPATDPLGGLAVYYDFLTWLQESLAEALLRR